MNYRTSAAATHFVCGGITLLRGLKGLVSPRELPQYSHVWNEFLFQYGGGLTSAVVGAGLVVLGLLTLRAKDPGEGTTALNFTYEAEIPLAPVMAAFLLFIGIGSFTSILPYTGERGVEPGQLGAALLLFPMMGAGAWFLLHYRRLAILDSISGVLEISYGKPWPALRLRYPFTQFQSVAIEEVERAKGKVYRLVATGTKGSKMITFCFSEDAARQCLASIVQATGWSSGAVPALKSA